ncbi:hypothetical protein J6590_089676 [Homalodisca vitripennis]|nr:hypothetical protein J6590_089676 [Homalodisca vitripennis]
MNKHTSKCVFKKHQFSRLRQQEPQLGAYVQGNTEEPRICLRTCTPTPVFVQGRYRRHSLINPLWGPGLASRGTAPCSTHSEAGDRPVSGARGQDRRPDPVSEERGGSAAGAAPHDPEDDSTQQDHRVLLKSSDRKLDKFPLVYQDPMIFKRIDYTNIRIQSSSRSTPSGWRNNCDIVYSWRESRVPPVMFRLGLARRQHNMETLTRLDNGAKVTQSPEVINSISDSEF